MDKLDLILENLSQMDSRFDAIEATLKQHGDLLRQHTDMITQLIGIVGSTNQKVGAMQADISALKEGQTRQDKILESLALRSLEQETELRELKRAK